MKIEQAINKLILLQAQGYKEVFFEDTLNGLTSEFVIGVETVVTNEVPKNEVVFSI